MKPAESDLAARPASFGVPISAGRVDNALGKESPMASALILPPAVPQTFSTLAPAASGHCLWTAKEDCVELFHKTRGRVSIRFVFGQ